MFLFLLITLLSFLSVHSNLITAPILKFWNRTTAREQELMQSRSKLASEQSELSMVDQFAKFSKIQRKINVIDQELQELRSQRTSSSFLSGIIVKYGFQIPLGIVLLFLSIYYRNTPLFVLDERYDIFPLSRLISYPNTEINAVSLHFWTISSTVMFKLVHF